MCVDAGGQSRGVAFVRFGSKYEAQMAINELNNKIPQGSVTPLVVKVIYRPACSQLLAFFIYLNNQFADSSDKKRKAQTVFGTGYGKPLRYDPMGGAGRQRTVSTAAVPPYSPAGIYLLLSLCSLFFQQL